MKPTIDEQIEAVKGCHADRTTTVDGRDEAVEAAIKTLEWVQRSVKPTLNAIMAEFPGSRVAVREDE